MLLYSVLFQDGISHAVSEDKTGKLIRLPTIIVAQGINFDVKFRPISRKDFYMYFSGGSMKRSLNVTLYYKNLNLFHGLLLLAPNTMGN